MKRQLFAVSIVAILAASVLASAAVPTRVNDQTTFGTTGLNTIDANVDYFRASTTWSPVLVANTSLTAGTGAFNGAVTGTTLVNTGKVVGSYGAFPEIIANTSVRTGTTWSPTVVANGTLTAGSGTIGALNVTNLSAALLTTPPANLRQAQSTRDEYRSTGRIFASFEPMNWTVNQGAATENTTDPYIGNTSLRLTDNATSRARIEKTYASAMDLREWDFSLAIKLENTTYASFVVTMSLFDSTNKEYRMRGALGPEATGMWYRVDFGLDSAADLTTDLADITKIQIARFDDTSTTVFFIDDLRIHPKADKAYILFTFDDGELDAYTTARPILEKYGYVGAVFVNSASVGTSGKMNVAQLQALDHHGWDVANHGAHHIQYDTATPAEQRADAEAGKLFLLQNDLGRAADIFRLPYSGVGTDTLSILDDYHRLAFTTAGSATGGNLRFTDPMKISATNGDNYVTARDAVNKSATERRLLFLTFHDITSPTDFEEVIKLVHTKEEAGVAAVLTPTQLARNIDRLHFG